MTVPSFYSSELSDRQSAFLGLLAHPLVTPWAFPALYSLVVRHHQGLEQWCARLGYRLLRIDQCFRLLRTPLGGRPAIPRGLPPSRRILILALLAAAILEDERQDSITLQEISDAVRRFAHVNEFRPYDPEQWRQRGELVEAVRFLVTHGVLEQRTRRADLLDSWERDGTGIGAGYVIHRDALVLFVDTRDAELALVADEPPVTNRGQHLLRQIIETQALEPGGLTDDERSYLVSQRSRLQDQAQEMTGGTLEIRADAWILVLPTDQGLDPALLVGFPEATAADWVALAMLDAAGQDATVTGQGRLLPSARVDDLAARLHADHASRLTVALRESPQSVREAAERQLRDAGLLVVDEAGDWLLLPAAGRYRAADLDGPGEAATPPPAATPTLFEDET